jgi:hypothetical protein
MERKNMISNVSSWPDIARPAMAIDVNEKIAPIIQSAARRLFILQASYSLGQPNDIISPYASHKTKHHRSVASNSIGRRKSPPY